MHRFKSIIKPLHILLVALSLISGTVKILGVRMDFMRVAQIGFENWKIILFGVIQIMIALLIAFKKSFKIGAIAYSIFYTYVSYHYFVNDLTPKVIPILLILLPIILLKLKQS